MDPRMRQQKDLNWYDLVPSSEMAIFLFIHFIGYWNNILRKYIGETY